MQAKFIARLLVVTVLFLNVSGQVKVNHKIERESNETSPPQFFPLAELKEGMRGSAKTVFRGSEPEGFDVEILGIVPSAIGPKLDLVVGRISGGGADRTQVFAGMSGSPVYINGRLLGAIAYAFPFSKEAICGITPIEQMIDIFENRSGRAGKAQKPRAFTFKEIAANEWRPKFLQSRPYTGSVPELGTGSKLEAIAGQTFRPIATPLAFGGFSQATLDRFAPELTKAGLLPVSATGGISKITPLKKADKNTLLGGDSVTMQLMRGDYSVAASGTVTLRDDSKIYAFGHPFMSLGTSSLPMAESSVVTVVPSMLNSFKLAVPSAMVGTMTQDRRTGVFGKLGESPKMIPVKIGLLTTRNQQKNYEFEVAKDDLLTPLLVMIAMSNSVTSNERSLGNSTIYLSGQISLKDEKPIIFDERFVGSSAGQAASVSVVVPLSILLQSRLKDLNIDRVELNLKAFDEAKTATLERLGVNKSEVKAGEEFEVQAYVRADTGRLFVRNVPVKLPLDTPTGKVVITVGDGRLMKFSSNSSKFVPKNVSELVEKINSARKPDRLYLQMHRVTKGAVIGSSELPNLPPSVLATINNSRTSGGFTPTVQTILSEREIRPAEFLINGRKSLSIQVTK